MVRKGNKSQANVEGFCVFHVYFCLGQFPKERISRTCPTDKLKRSAKVGGGSAVVVVVMKY